MKIIEQNILEITKGIIAHQVNNKGVMGAGLALAIRKKYPVVYKEYKLLYDIKMLTLGFGYYTKINEELYIYNMISQNGYGRERKQYTDYRAMKTSLLILKVLSSDMGLPVFIPYEIGCGLGGGNWEIVSQIIEERIPEAIICKLPLDK